MKLAQRISLCDQSEFYGQYDEADQQLVTGQAAQPSLLKSLPRSKADSQVREMRLVGIARFRWDEMTLALKDTAGDPLAEFVERFAKPFHLGK